jgi:hypothetical protein
VDGQLRCLGPIQSLKSRYGTGYKLDLRYEPVAGAASALTRFLSDSLPGSSLEEDEPPRMAFTVPQHGVGNLSLSQIFAQLARAKAEHGVLECSLTQCTAGTCT